MGLSLFFEGVSAAATAGALAAAIVAGVQAKRLYSIESARDAAARQADQRRQASQISAWAAVRIKVGGLPVHGVLVRNSSDDPVYDVQVSCRGFSEESTPPLTCVPPGEYFVANMIAQKEDGSSSEWDHAKPVGELRDPIRPFTASDDKGVDALSFRDNAGRPWRRTASGVLVPTD